MKNHLNLRNAALVASLAAIGATAWAATEYADLDRHAVPAQDEVIAATATPVAMSPQPAATGNEPVTPVEGVTANETVVVPDKPAPAPVVEQSIVQPPLTIEDHRLTVDQRLQALVMDKLSQAPNISGKIGVESHDAVITLTGYTVTAGQAYRAGRYAGSIDGVKSVQNELRARIGGSV